MPTVSELKERASSYEEHGQFEKALAIYDHILKHLEGQPAIAKVVPLFVKVGDLRLNLDHSGDAVAAYEAAAEHYARQGSSQRVTAMCRKILGIQPGRLGVRAKFARQLMEHGHVGAATDVLVAFAQERQLDKAVEVLDELEGRPDDEVKPMLESLLDSMDRGEPLKAEETARRVSTRLSIATDAIVGELSNLWTETSSGEDVGTGEATEADRTSEALTPEPFDLGLTTGELATEPETQSEEEGEEAPAAATHEPRTTGLTPAVLVGGGFLVGLLSGVGLAMAGIIPIGGGNGNQAQLPSIPSLVQLSEARAPAPVIPFADTTAVADTSGAGDASIDAALATDTAAVAGLSPIDSLGTPSDTTTPTSAR